MPSLSRLVFALLIFAAPVWARDPAPKPTGPPPITAQSYFLLDLDSSRVLAEKNGRQRMFPASTTKIMTCLVALENAKLDKVIKVGPNAAKTGESGIYLLAGEQFSLADLIRAAMIKSANDACVAIAEGVSGSQEKFVALMNKKAKELGCLDTHFTNPHGLHDPDHYTSAHDLAVIGKAALENEFIDRVSQQKTAEIHGNWKIGPKRLLVNRNKLLWRWHQCDGLKTGYTKQAGNCLVASATTRDATGNPWRLICVVMKTVPGASWGDAHQILQNQGFSQYQPQTVAKAGELKSEGPIKGGAFPLEAILARDVHLPMRANERANLEEKTRIFDLTAPIQKGQPVGTVEFLSAGKPLATVALTARDDVPKTLLAKAIPPIGNQFSLVSPAMRFLILGGIVFLAAAILIFRKLYDYGRTDLTRKPRNPNRTSSRNAAARRN